jgi:methionyl-tRNA synthetase
MEKYDCMTAANYIWKKIMELDQYIQENEPFKVIKVDEEKGKKHLEYMRDSLFAVAVLLAPFMPETSSTVKEIIQTNKMPEKPLFPRYE